MDDRATGRGRSRHPNRLGRRFWALWTSRTCSGLGDGINAVALPLLAATLTRRPIVVAGVLTASRLSWLLVALPAGALADRVDRARLMRWVDAIRAVLLAAVAATVATGRMTIAGVYAFGLVMGACDPFFLAASQAVLPDIVADRDLTRANGILYVGGASAEQSVGPAVSGLLFSVGRALPFAADAASFVGSGIALLGLGRDPHRPEPVDSIRSGHPPRAGFAAEIRAGLAWYRRSRSLCLLTGTVAVLAFSQAMVSAIIVLFALERLHLSGTGYGVFMGLTAVGNVLGGVVARRVIARFGTARCLLGAIGLAGAAYLATAWTQSAVLAAALLAVEAVVVVVGNIATLSFRQRITPPDMQARVATVWRTAVWGTIPLGALVGGAVASASDLVAPFVVAGSLQLLLLAGVAGPIRRAVQETPA